MSRPGRLRAFLGGFWFFYRSFGALNFTLIVIGIGFLVGAEILDLAKSREIAAILRRKEVPDRDVDTTPDLEAWRSLETFEDREAYLEDAFHRLALSRVRWQEERDRLETRLKSEGASIEQARAEVESRLESIASSEKGFDQRQQAWEKTVEEQAFQDQLAIYQNEKDDILADLLLNRTGRGGDLYIGRVLRALASENPRKAAKLKGAMQEHELGGPLRLNRIEDLWREAQAPIESPGAVPSQEQSNGEEPF